MVNLNDIGGLWRRQSIAWPDEPPDTETEVYWLQGPHLYADLRVPPGRPAQAPYSCLRDLDRPMLDFMARQEGFFGHLEVADSIGHWHRAFDYRPADGFSDRGLLALDGTTLIERGVEQPYVEHWSREAHSAAETMALSLVADAPAAIGCLVVTGDAFLYGRSRTSPLPPGTTLTELLEAASSSKAAQDLFDCELSFGRRAGADWRIVRSSLCFREGATLAPRLGREARSLALDDVNPDGTAMRRHWRIAVSESSVAGPLTRWFDGAAPAGAVIRCAGTGGTADQ